MVAGERFTPQPQVGEVTWAPLVDPDDVEVAWTQPAEIVDRLVRAAAPDPGAFTGIGDELLVIYSGTPVAAGRFAGLAPGTPFVRGGVAHIKCGEGAFRLGWLRLGNLVAYVPEAVVNGFTIGIAIIIATSQLKDFFGLSLAKAVMKFHGGALELADNAPGLSVAMLFYTLREAKR